MFKNKIKILTIFVLTIFVFGCAGLQKNYKPTKTSLELQAMQKREFDAPYQTVFNATLSVFQDKGYTVTSADAGTGFITASSPESIQRKVNFLFAVDYVEHTKATAFIESMSAKKVAVRLNFVNHQKSVYSDFQNSVPVEDTKFYQRIFEKIYIAILMRTNQ